LINIFWEGGGKFSYGEKETFTDLDFADDVTLFAEMLSVLILALEFMEMQARPLN